jgi:hypothetical protein
MALGPGPGRAKRSEQDKCARDDVHRGTRPMLTSSTSLHRACSRHSHSRQNVRSRSRSRRPLDPCPTRRVQVKPPASLTLPDVSPNMSTPLSTTNNKVREDLGCQPWARSRPAPCQIGPNSAASRDAARPARRDPFCEDRLFLAGRACRSELGLQLGDVGVRQSMSEALATTVRLAEA